MKTYREIVYSIIEFVSSFHVTDDSRLDEVLVAKKVDDVRATLIKQEYIANRHVDDLFYQRCKVKIDETTETMEGEMGQSKNVLQFEITFPELLPNVEWANIKYLGSKDFINRYNRRSMNGMHSSGGRYWSRDMVDYTVLSTQKALVRNEKKNKEIVVVALFKSPMQVPGYSWDDGYPVPDPFKLEMIVKQDIMAGLGVPMDDTNDARHNDHKIQGGQ